MDELASKPRIATELERARRATEALLEPLSDDALRQQVSPLQSPLVWDYAHIAYFEELWLLRGVAGADPIASRYDDLYDAFQHERNERGDLPLLDPAAARAYAADVRSPRTRGARPCRSRERRPAASRRFRVRAGPPTRAAAPGDDAADPAAPRRAVPDPAARLGHDGSGRARQRARPGRPLHPAGPPTNRGPTTTSARHTRSSCPASESTGCPSRTRATSSSSRIAATTTRVSGASAAGRGDRMRRRRSRSIGDQARTGSCAGGSDTQKLCHRTNRSSRSRSSRPRRSLAGPASAFRPSRNGSRPPAGAEPIPARSRT